MTTEAHDPKRDYILRGPDGKTFHCDGHHGEGCGCNVFRKPDPARLNHYRCNSCGAGWINEPQ